MSSKRTKIVATIGPSCSSVEMIEELIKSGMNVARINCSHADHAFIETTVSRVRQARAQADQAVAILLDLSGPKLRTRGLIGKRIDIKPGDRLTLTSRDVEGAKDIAGTNYDHLAKDVKAGDRILLDDGLIELKVLKVTGPDVECEIKSGGILRDRQGINIPGVRLSIPALTDKDRSDLAYGISQGVDYVALSFVRDAEDIKELRALICNLLNETSCDQPAVPIVAKLEMPEAIQKVDEILEVADAVMIARGDLGVEVPPEMVPPLQKSIIKKANAKGKPVITATQMLESMVSHPRPTRAEASDVANAIYDGTDAIMLSEETATGQFPLEAVRIMNRIACQAESSADFCKLRDQRLPTAAHAIAHAACAMALDMQAKAIATFTKTGSTAQLIAQFRPAQPIIALTQHINVYRELALLWGTTPLMMTEASDSEATLAMVEKVLHQKGLVQAGDDIVITGGLPIAARGPANFVKLSKIAKVEPTAKEKELRAEAQPSHALAKK
jgi:pyruvate kinase